MAEDELAAALTDIARTLAPELQGLIGDLLEGKAPDDSWEALLKGALDEAGSALHLPLCRSGKYTIASLVRRR